MEKDSMLYWWPKATTPPRVVPMPETVMVKHHVRMSDQFGVSGIDTIERKVQAAVDRVGMPVFIRTDQMSGKHAWKDTCYYDGSQELWKHITQLCEESWSCDLFGVRVAGFAVRQYIELDAPFKAFWGEMPVARERRYFVEDGEVLCHHPYWIEKAINRPSTSAWEGLLKKLNREPKHEIKTLTAYAEDLSCKLPGYWSLDFARAKTGGWYFIDAATGEHSWHPECPIATARPRDTGFEDREPI